jgi:hypothetical protein
MRKIKAKNAPPALSGRRDRVGVFNGRLLACLNLFTLLNISITYIPKSREEAKICKT